MCASAQRNNNSSRILCLDNKDSLQKKMRENLDFIQDKERFLHLFEDIQFPITLVIEEYYSDRDYKDSYYHFFASKYHDFGKYTHRIVILEREITEQEIYNKNFSLKKKIIGLLTIRPFKTGNIGKALFNPKKLQLGNVLIRTTKFAVGLFGRKFRINTFPFSSQDGEYMTCAETALWGILQYYGARYKEYRAALPHEIVDIAENEAYERASPSHGLNYAHISKVLKNFGFSPKIYSRKYESNNKAEFLDFKRMFHYYVESGIPLMVGIRFDKETTGHVVLCVGRRNSMPKQIQYETLDKKCQIDSTEPELKDNKYQIANSADFVEEYVFMDDNKRPFTLNKLDDFCYEKETIIKYFIAPLYKRIFLEAKDAERIFYNTLQNKILGLKNISPEPTKVVIRIFLTTSRNYKASRFQALEKSYRIIDRIPMPKFLWICEISTEEQYRKGKVCAEIVLDATASKRDVSESIILLRYPERIGTKTFDETLQDLEEKINRKNPYLEIDFDTFKSNLMEVNNG